MKLKHKKWISIYIERPKDGAKVTSRIAGQDGYCGSGTYDSESATFRTFEDAGNRLIITIWKHDEWYYT